MQYLITGVMIIMAVFSVFAAIAFVLGLPFYLILGEDNARKIVGLTDDYEFFELVARCGVYMGLPTIVIGILIYGIIIFRNYTLRESEINKIKLKSGQSLPSEHLTLIVNQNTGLTYSITKRRVVRRGYKDVIEEYTLDRKQEEEHFYKCFPRRTSRNDIKKIENIIDCLCTYIENQISNYDICSERYKFEEYTTVKAKIGSQLIPKNGSFHGVKENTQQYIEKYDLDFYGEKYEIKDEKIHIYFRVRKSKTWLKQNEKHRIDLASSILEKKSEIISNAFNFFKFGYNNLCLQTLDIIQDGTDKNLIHFIVSYTDISKIMSFLNGLQNNNLKTYLINSPELVTQISNSKKSRNTLQALNALDIHLSYFLSNNPSSAIQIGCSNNALAMSGVLNCLFECFSEYVCHKVDNKDNFNSCFLYVSKLDRRDVYKIGPSFTNLSEENNGTVLKLDYTLPNGIGIKDLERQKERMESFIKYPIERIEGDNSQVSIYVTLQQVDVKEMYTKEVNYSLEYKIPIGKSALNGDDIYYDITSKHAGHAFVIGKTGSGKSSWARGFILSIIKHANPNNTKIVFISSSNDFQIFVNKKAPHILAPVGENDIYPDILKRLKQEMNLRKQKFNQEGVGVKDIHEYRKIKKTGYFENSDIPFWFIVFDEFGNALRNLNGDYAALDEVQNNINILMAETRKYGIYFIFLTQKNTDINLVKQNCKNILCLPIQGAQESNMVLEESGGEKLNSGEGYFKFEGNDKTKIVFQDMSDTIELGEIIEKRVIRINAKYQLVNQNYDTLKDFIGEIAGNDSQKGYNIQPVEF